MQADDDDDGDWGDPDLDALELSALGLDDTVDPASPRPAAWIKDQTVGTPHRVPHAAAGSSLEGLSPSTAAGALQSPESPAMGSQGRQGGWYSELSDADVGAAEQLLNDGGSTGT